MFNLYAQNVQNNRASYAYPFSKMLDGVLQANDTLTVLHSIVAAFASYNPSVTCVTTAPALKATVPFDWIQCTYVPYTWPLTSKGSIFGSFPANASYPSSIDFRCIPFFNMSANLGGLGYQRKIRIDQETLDMTPRLIFSENLWDPVTPFGPDNNVPSWNANGSRMYYVPGTSHIEDILVEQPTDSIGLLNARKAYLQIFKEWLGQV